MEIIKKICFGFFRKTTYHFRCTSSIFPLNNIKPVMPLLQQLLLIIIIIIITIIIVIVIVIVMIITH